MSLVFSSAISSISAESALPLAGNILGYVFDEMGTVINSFDDNSIILTKSNIGMNYDDYVAVLSPDGNFHIYQKTDIVRSFVLMKPDTDVSKINELLTEYDYGRINAALPEHHTRLVKVGESGDVYMLQTRLQDINEIYDIIKSDADVLSIYERKQINKVDGHLYYLMINSPESQEEIIGTFDKLKLIAKDKPFIAEGSDKLKKWEHSFVIGDVEKKPETFEQISQLYSKYDDFELTFWVSTEEEGNSSVYFSESSTVYSSENSKSGDLNFDGKTDLTDLSELSLALVGDKELTEAQQKAADVDGDGAVKLADLAKYRQFLSKIISSL